MRRGNSWSLPKDSESDAMTKFAVYFHPETILTSKPREQIMFEGFSLPYYDKVWQALADALQEYPQLPLRKAQYDDYLRVHDKLYLEKLQQMARDEAPEEMPRLSAECLGFEYCLPGYLYGLGGMFAAVDRMRAGELERAYCFCLGGHHAYADRGHGYCLLNPLATAARYAQEKGFAHVLIVDWDIHHGDGTQSIFANDKSVYCISIHSVADLYMAFARSLKNGTTAAAEEVGHCNIPILHQAYGADEFAELNLKGRFYRAAESIPAFEAALANLPWKPDIILVFSGYDSHQDDCGKDITDWRDDDFRKLTRLVLGAAQAAHCPVLSAHGGGYKLPVTVSAALSHIEELAG